MDVRNIYLGKQGEIWIGTYGDGLWLMKGKKITKFPLDENRYLSSVHCIVEDRNGFFWLPTNKGLFRVAKDQLLNYHHSKGKRNDPFYFYYARESGFNTNEFNGGCQPCAVRTGNDFVSLPSMNGLVWFHPEQIEYDVPDKNIFVDGFEMDDKFYNIDSDTINLPLNLASLKLLVSTPYFGHNDNVKIDYLLANESGRFKLRGRVDMTMEKPALSLSHLPGGTYNLEFRLANGSTLQPFTSKKLTLLSPYYYYETPAFRVFVFLFLCCAVLVIIRYRTRSVEKRNEHLEQLVSQRTEELQNTLGVLMETEKELEDRISKQSGIIASISHDINTPLRYHTLLIEHSKKLLEERNLEGLETVHETLAVSIGQLTTLTNNLLEYIKIQRFESSHLEGLVALHDIVDQKVELFKPILNLRNNRFINELDGSLKVRSNPVLLGIIIHNLLDNAYKYTYQGVILISTEIKEGNTVLTIYNSQGGMPAETIEWLTSGSKDLPRAAGNNKGLGLLIVKEMATILNIRISAIASDADTAISLWFSGNVTGVPSTEEGTPTEN